MNLMQKEHTFWIVTLITGMFIKATGVIKIKANVKSKQLKRMFRLFFAKNRGNA